MVAAIATTLLAGLLVFYRHWHFELPLYPNVDEQLSLDCIYDLLSIFTQVISMYWISSGIPI